jgi:hypothetical protein
MIDAAGEAKRAAGLVIKSLTDLGYAWQTAVGDVITVRFTSVSIGEFLGATWAICEVDTQRLPRKVTARDLTKAETVHHLATVTGHLVRCLNSTGVTYCIRLTPASSPARLPTRVPLDLDSRPAGDLLVPVGVGRSGAVWAELPALGHTLVTGTTGSGKSNWIHAALAGLLPVTDRARVQVALVDPKRSEFAAWGGVPQLYGDIATDEASAARFLDMLVGEMERRGDLLAGVLARDLAGYNQRAAQPLPYMLVVVDEVLDLLLRAGNRRIETALVSLAAKGRSAGILLWIATQHARYDLLPRMVNLNLASRLVFRVQDARAAELAGCPGAEQISRARPGRMLAKLGDAPQPVQAFWIDDRRLGEVVGALGATPPAPRPVLDEVDARLVRYAVVELDGRFAINALAAAFAGQGVTHHRVRTLAARLEARRLLDPQEGPNAGRRVTEELARLANALPAGGAV